MGPTMGPTGSVGIPMSCSPLYYPSLLHSSNPDLKLLCLANPSHQMLALLTTVLKDYDSDRLFCAYGTKIITLAGRLFHALTTLSQKKALRISALCGLKVYIL